MHSYTDIHSILNGEELIFKVKSASPMPATKSLMALVFGVILMPAMIFVFYNSGCAVTDFFSCIAAENVFPYVIAFILFLTGAAAFVSGIKNLLSDGPLFVGTPKRLILIRNNSTESIQWNQFLGEISVSGDQNIGTITLKKKTGKFHSNDSGPRRFAHDELYMVKIERPREIEAFCRQYIMKT